MKESTTSLNESTSKKVTLNIYITKSTLLNYARSTSTLSAEKSDLLIKYMISYCAWSIQTNIIYLFKTHKLIVCLNIFILIKMHHVPSSDNFLYIYFKSHIFILIFLKKIFVKGMFSYLNPN